MSTKDKAEELVLKYLRIDNNTKEWFNIHIAKQCALIAVDAIIKALNDDIYIQGETDIDSHIEYWKEVKQEINNL